MAIGFTALTESVWVMLLFSTVAWKFDWCSIRRIDDDAVEQSVIGYGVVPCSNRIETRAPAPTVLVGKQST